MAIIITGGVSWALRVDKLLIVVGATGSEAPSIYATRHSVLTRVRRSSATMRSRVCIHAVSTQPSEREQNDDIVCVTRA